LAHINIFSVVKFVDLDVTNKVMMSTTIIYY